MPSDILHKLPVLNFIRTFQQASDCTKNRENESAVRQAPVTLLCPKRNLHSISRPPAFKFLIDGKQHTIRIQNIMQHCRFR